MNSYLRILLSNGKYLIDTNLVNKVLDIENVNIKGVPVQNIGDFNSFIGVSNIDGDIVPILDLKKELGLESIPEKFDKKLYPSSQFDDGRKDTTIKIPGSFMFPANLGMNFRIICSFSLCRVHFPLLSLGISLAETWKYCSKKSS